MKFKELEKVKEDTCYHYVAEGSMGYVTLFSGSKKSDTLRDLIDSDICNLDYDLFLDELEAVGLLRKRIADADRLLAAIERSLNKSKE